MFGEIPADQHELSEIEESVAARSIEVGQRTGQLLTGCVGSQHSNPYIATPFPQNSLISLNLCVRT